METADQTQKVPAHIHLLTNNKMLTEFSCFHFFSKSCFQFPFKFILDFMSLEISTQLGLSGISGN